MLKKFGSINCMYSHISFVPAPNSPVQPTNQEMANKRLGEKDIEQLLTQYRGERRRLSFQLERVREAIKDLKTVRARAEANKTTDGPVIKRGPGRPRKTDLNGTPTAGRKPGRRKKRTVKEGGYRLSDWDQMVIDS